VYGELHLGGEHGGEAEDRRVGWLDVSGLVESVVASGRSHRRHGSRQQVPLRERQVIVGIPVQMGPCRLLYRDIKLLFIFWCRWALVGYCTGIRVALVVSSPPMHGSLSTDCVKASFLWHRLPLVVGSLNMAAYVRALIRRESG
jgi:hypothetical protein